MTILYLVRHGITKSNVEERHIGQREEELTEEGRQQAKSLAELLKGEQLDAILSSPQIRAVETALEIAMYYPNKTSNFGDPRLKELDLGIFDGRMPKAARQLYQDAYAKREQDKFGFRIPNGESYEMLITRVRPFVEEVLNQYPDGNVCVVGHQGLNRALLACLLGDKLTREQIPRLAIPHDAYIKVTKTQAQATAIVISPVRQHGLEYRL